ncbi:hypothetical protein PENSUB_4241 [Penicillium subrubescens]|uniref:Uncharacterized protein n=1 Tax=Penicillium subrubescens TaxID=1316194 RepID=A0A1Q5UCY3_9EURO|nr:hypothetical protein PENSUB_4241 [Penicillium subrubescens]
MTLLATGPNIRKRGRPRNYPSEEQRREARTIQRRHQRRRQFARAAEAANDAAQISPYCANFVRVHSEPIRWLLRPPPASRRTGIVAFVSSRSTRRKSSRGGRPAASPADPHGPAGIRSSDELGGGSDSSIDGITKGEIR